MYGKCLKISNTTPLLFVNKMLVIRAGSHKNPDQTASSGSLILDCAFCLNLFCRQFLFETLENYRTYRIMIETLANKFYKTI